MITRNVCIYGIAVLRGACVCTIYVTTLFNHHCTKSVDVTFATNVSNFLTLLFKVWFLSAISLLTTDINLYSTTGDIVRKKNHTFSEFTCKGSIPVGLC